MPKKLLVLEAIPGLPPTVVAVVDTSMEAIEEVMKDKEEHPSQSRRYVTIACDPVA